MTLKTKQQGFTIVELLIVIVVIGILAALVITTFTGIQRRARNTERETDIKAIHGQVEAYFAQEGHYPTLGNLNDSDWRGINMRGLDDGALYDPRGNEESETPISATAGQDVYAYAVLPEGCDNGEGGDCTDYRLTATLEGDGNPTYVKEALN